MSAADRAFTASANACRSNCLASRGGARHIFIVLSQPLWRDRARRISFPPEGIWGALNTVLGSGIAYYALQDATKYLWIVAILGIGGAQGFQAYRNEKRRKRVLHNDFQRRLTVLYHQLHKLWQPIHNRDVLNNQAIRVARAKNDLLALKQLEDEKVDIEQAKNDAAVAYRIDFSPEAASLPNQVYLEFGVDPSGVLDIIGDHLWNASFDDIKKISDALQVLARRLYDEW